MCDEALAGRVHLRPRQVAGYLGMSLTSVYDRLRRGELPAVRIGTAWRIPVAELQEYLRASRVTAPKGGA